jgi:heptaprenyl diphosphate synthase
MTKTKKFTYKDSYRRVQEKVDEILSSSPLLIREYTAHLAKATGKMIRAQALLVCAMDNQNQIHKDAVDFASAIELLHLATLVHDDVIDNSDLRRGQLSLQKKYGQRTAVICGDYLLCVALMTASAMENKEPYLHRTIPNYMQKICLGELRQHTNNGNFHLSVMTYLKIISGKTAGLFEASFYGGALLSKENILHSELREYAKLGHNIGMVFQLTDDLMDFETTEHVAQKPVQSDFEQNVITLPLIHAFSKDESLRTKAIQKQLLREELNRKVRETGGLDYTRKMAKKYREKSSKIIKELEITKEKQEKLFQLLEKSYREFTS